MTRRRRISPRMTAEQVLAECSRLGICLGADRRGFLYYWNHYDSDYLFTQEKISDRLWGAVSRNYFELLRLVRKMDARMIEDMGAEEFDQAPGINDVPSDGSDTPVHDDSQQGTE